MPIPKAKRNRKEEKKRTAVAFFVP